MDILKKWWFWLISVSIVLLIMSYMPFWKVCNPDTCIAVNFWWSIQ